MSVRCGGETTIANGDFQKGTWVQLPSNCTQSLKLTYERCAEYGTQVFWQCVDHVTVLVNKCVDGVWNTVKNCSWWSWFFCLLYAVVSTFVCLAFALIAATICGLFALVEVTICLLWTLISIILCLSNAQGGTAFLLTDGTVMIQEFKSVNPYYLGIPLLAWATKRWWKSTPDQFGSYEKGTWSRLAYSRLGRAGFASAVLADGRVVVCGGEYTDYLGAYANDDNNSCEIYDPVANTWEMVPTPTLPDSTTVWEHVGDAPCTLLPDGTLLMGSIFDKNIAKLDPVAVQWTAMNPRPKVGSSTEESWVLMPDNTIAAPSCISSPGVWVYDIQHDKWTAGTPPMNSVVNFAFETGPALLRYDGTAFFLGSIQHTAIYSPTANPQWINGADIPNVDGLVIGIEDGPAAMLVNGNVLFAAGSGEDDGLASSPCWFFEYDGSTFNRTNDPPNYQAVTFVSRLLLLPDGSVLFCRQDDSSSTPTNLRPLLKTVIDP